MQVEKRPGAFSKINESQVRRAQSDGEPNLKKGSERYQIIISESQVRRAQSDGESQFKKRPGTFPNHNK